MPAWSTSSARSASRPWTRPSLCSRPREPWTRRSPGCSATCSTAPRRPIRRPALAATLFELTGEPPPGPDSALVRWLLAEPVVTGRDAFAYSTGWRADALLLRALAGPRRCQRERRDSAAHRLRDHRLVRRHDRPHRRAAARPRAASRGTRGDRRLRADARAGRRGRAAHRDRARRRSRVGPDGPRRAGRGPARMPARGRGRGGARQPRRLPGRRDPGSPPRASRRLGPRVGTRRGPVGGALESHPCGATDIPVSRNPRRRDGRRRRPPLDPALDPLRARSAGTNVWRYGRRLPPRRLPRRSPSGRCGLPRSASPRMSRTPATTRSARSADGS